MILKNWYKLLAFVMCQDKSVNVVNVKGTEIIPGSTVEFSPNASQALALNGYIDVCPSLWSLRTSYENYGGVILGDGNAPVLFDDYKLSGNVLTAATTNGKPTVTVDADGFSATVTHTMVNTGTTDITISEVGLMAKSGQTTSENASYLIERTVLDSPVTIPAGGVGQVTYTIRMVYPTE